MLAFIGVLALCWVGFKVFQNFFGSAVLSMQMRAIDYATEHGVPRVFAAHLCECPEVIKLAIQTLSRVEAGFAQVPGGEKYGRAIVYLYARHLQSEEKQLAQKLASEKGKLIAFLKPQIEELESGGFHLYLNEVVYAYIGALACNMTGGSISTKQIHALVLEIFKNKTSAGAVENAYQIVQMAENDFLEKFGALMPVVEDELAVGKGTYLVKYIKKVNLAFEERASGRKELGHWQDIANITLHQYLGLDA